MLARNLNSHKRATSQQKGGQTDQKKFREDQVVAGFEAYLKQDLKISSKASEREFAEAQWYLLLKNALDASLPHLKRGEDFKVGINNQEGLEVQSYANTTASAINKIWAQGDLKLDQMPDALFFPSAKYLDWRPICDAETVQLWECEIYLFSDSVLKLGNNRKGGNAQSKWINKYEEALRWLPKESDLRLKTIHGQSFKYQSKQGQPRQVC